jgi:hypothetical protein
VRLPHADEAMRYKRFMFKKKKERTAQPETDKGDS